MTGSIDRPLRIALIGGGHGLAMALSGLRRSDVSVTAIVSTADDGGSSGRLRAMLGGHAPGDARRCLLALSDGSLLGSALERRFDSGELSGHVVGNLLIAALADTAGDFAGALDEVGRLLGSRGRVLPASLEPVDLGALTSRGPVEGEVSVSSSGIVRRVWVEPAEAHAHPESLAAIATADTIVFGPGSLFTSVLAALMVPGIVDALERSPARRVYVCNVAPQRNETDGLDAADHLDALLSHRVPVDVMLVDSSSVLPLGSPARPVIDRQVSASNGHSHDPDRLGDVLVEIARSRWTAARVPSPDVSPSGRLALGVTKKSDDGFGTESGQGHTGPPLWTECCAAMGWGESRLGFSR